MYLPDDSVCCAYGCSAKAHELCDKHRLTDAERAVMLTAEILNVEWCRVQPRIGRGMIEILNQLERDHDTLRAESAPKPRYIEQGCVRGTYIQDTHTGASLSASDCAKLLNATEAKP